MANMNTSAFTVPGFINPVTNGVTCNPPPGLAGCSYGPDGSSTTPNNTGQVVQAGGTWADSRRIFPVTVTNSASLWATIQHAVPDTTFWPFILRNDTEAYPASTILAGQSGYLSFIPYEHCVNGTISGCTGDGFPADGTNITVCAPKSLPVGVGNCTTPGGTNCLDGIVKWQYTDATTAAGVKCYICTTSAKSAGTNAASVMRVEVMSLMVLVMSVGWLLVGRL